MLQQTTVAAVRTYFEAFVAKWPSVSDLAQAQDADVMAAWAGLGYYARARNLLKCARVVAQDLGGVFPDTVPDLLKLPGVGPYTAAALASIAFDRPAPVLDGNVERVMARLYRVAQPLPKAKTLLGQHACALTPHERPGDYAQAVMDLGATVCTPKSPACGVCPWAQFCAARSWGDPLEFPRRLPKTRKPTRLGVAYVACREDGAILLERRPDRGLLGGMLGWPGSEWAECLQASAPPVAADWVEVAGEVRHTFTHFHLRLRVLLAQVAVDCEPATGAFQTKDNFRADDLPTVMRKVWALANSENG